MTALRLLVTTRVTTPSVYYGAGCKESVTSPFSQIALCPILDLNTTKTPVGMLDSVDRFLSHPVLNK